MKSIPGYAQERVFLFILSSSGEQICMPLSLEEITRLWETREGRERVLPPFLNQEQVRKP